MNPPDRPERHGATQSSLREHNLGLVARTVGASGRPITRADVAHLTSLTRPTVSRLVDDLIAARVIVELPTAPTEGAGRPGIPLAPASGTLVALGLEVNVDYLGGVVVDLTGAILAARVEPRDLRASEPAAVLADLKHLATGLAARATAAGASVVGAGIALPGLVDSDGSRLRLAPNLGWRDIDPRALVNLDDLGPAPIVANEADLAALAEASLMRSTDPAARSFIYVSGEIGIGASIVLGGVPFRGRHGWSGEIGHMRAQAGGPPCRCGSTGCLEVFAGTASIAAAAGIDTANDGADAMGAVRAAAEAGDDAAVAAIRRAGAALGAVLADVVNLLDIPMIILGNRYASLATLLEPAIAEALTARVLSAPWAPPAVRPALSGERSAMIGAARSVLDTVLADPAAWMARTAPRA